MNAIQMVDLSTQYKKIKLEIDSAVSQCLLDGTFINGSEVGLFQARLAEFLHVKYVVTCANGTDALQIAMMALQLKPGDEVIVPAFTYVATAEVLVLLGLTPVMVDIDANTFNVTAELIEKAITVKTKAIVPVHLFGQCCDMEPILELAYKHHLYVVEDTAQALGSIYSFSDGRKMAAGTMGDIGCTSFFPSKNLGGYGDGGALMLNNDDLAKRVRMVANHGQQQKYHHEILGINSRLDTIQAAVLNVKLSYLDKYNAERIAVADYYDKQLSGSKYWVVPMRSLKSTHVFHQYTLKLKGIDREDLQHFLSEAGIPTMVYYPIPLHSQEAFKNDRYKWGDFSVAEGLCKSVLSLPMHTELSLEQLVYITSKMLTYGNSNK